MDKPKLDARMEYAESVLRKLPKHDPTIAVADLLGEYEADSREEIWESIQAYADIRARQAIFSEQETANARIAELERILDGLPQDAIDGGWTARGISAYAKKLEDQIATPTLADEGKSATDVANLTGDVCKLCNSTGRDTPCAYPTEINRQQAKRISELSVRLATLTDTSEMEKVRKDALEEAAKAAENVGAPVWTNDGFGTRFIGTSIDAAHAIRALAALQPKDAREAT